jgi:hypothetical protein
MNMLPAESRSGRREAPDAARRQPTGAGLLPPPHRTVREVLPHTAHRRPSPVGIRLHPPRPVRSWGDDASIEVDQPEPGRRLVGDHQPAVASRLVMALRHEEREPRERVRADLVEGAGGVSVAEVARPAAQEVFMSCTTSSTESSSRSRAVSSRMRLRACCIAWCEGQRARKVT